MRFGAGREVSPIFPCGATDLLAGLRSNAALSVQLLLRFCLAARGS
jgi:hypothetical protein